MKTLSLSNWNTHEYDIKEIDARDRWRTITEPQPSSTDLIGWITYLEGRGFETKVHKTATGYVLRAKNIYGRVE